MAVYRPTKDSKVWWYDFVFEGQRVRESAKTRSKTVAKAAERVRRRELEESYNGIKRRDRAKLFSVSADEWLTLKSLTLAASSQRIERDNLKHLRPHFEKRLVTDIQAKDVSRYQQARLAEGASPKTVNLEVGTLRAILRRHRVWAEIQQDVRMLSTLDDVGHAITPEEEAALLTACLKSRCRCLYLAVMLAPEHGNAVQRNPLAALETGRLRGQDVDGRQVQIANGSRTRDPVKQSNPWRAGDVGCTVSRPTTRTLCFSQ